MTNRPNGTLYVGVTGNIVRRAWKVGLILEANPAWADLYDTLVWRDGGKVRGTAPRGWPEQVRP
jgi:predicted GIY-YIG superfamily endonuclease